MTDSERLLWSRLRAEQMGVKFRRQHPLGHYVADFACLDPKIVVELDGSQHQEQQAYDERRDAFFAQQGFKVLRFPTNAPMVNLEGVLTVIAEEIQGAVRAPTPALPRRGREQEKTETGQEFP